MRNKFCSFCGVQPETIVNNFCTDCFKQYYEQWLLENKSEGFCFNCNKSKTLYNNYCYQCVVGSLKIFFCNSQIVTLLNHARDITDRFDRKLNNNETFSHREFKELLINSKILFDALSGVSNYNLNNNFIPGCLEDHKNNDLLDNSINEMYTM